MMDPGLSFIQGDLWAPQQRHSVAALDSLNYNHAYRPVESDYDPVALREDDYCPYCQKSEVLRDFCSCVSTDRSQGSGSHCDCAGSCTCVTCKPWRQQDQTSQSSIVNRGRNRIRFAEDTGMTSHVKDNSDSHQHHQSLSQSPAYRRRQSRSLHSNVDREREMAIAARETGIRNVRRRTMSAGAPNDVRVFLKHSSFCECCGSGVGCQCGRICYCD
ncbi:hypothetical protein BDF22DRAFT_679352 [Syncephalis plumigaleata]|nr:hypothetical protein BDF22DRAFT_679352 [Syncephalis plumigaleata]